jgi:putative ABC transport system permease protein
MIEDFFVACWLSFKQVTRSNKKSVIMTIMVVALLFIDILFVSSMISGTIDTVDNQVIKYQIANVEIEPSKESAIDDYIKQADKKIADIESVPGVVGVVSHYKEATKITFDQNEDGHNVKDGSWYVYSVDPAKEPKVLDIKSHIVAGRYLEDGDRNKIVLGREISGGYNATLEKRSLGDVKVGENIYVYYSNGVVRKYEVVGIFVTKNTLADAQAYVTKDEMEDVLGQHDLADEIIVKTATTGDEDKYISRIKNVVGENLDYYNWNDYLGVLASSIDSFEFIKFVFYVIGLVVSGASIFIIIYINLLNQRRQIGILRAIGMKSRIIITSYVLQAFFLGLLGIILGAISMRYVIYPYFVKHPFDLALGNVSLLIKNVDMLKTELSMLGVSLVAGFIPSLQITKKNILDSIFK